MLLHQARAAEVLRLRNAGEAFPDILRPREAGELAAAARVEYLRAGNSESLAACIDAALRRFARGDAT